ncbi:MGAP-like protein [Mya arenaria]|uniref:MGAP-like protein n=1 Tax=Mya arenaria TaxID=6604 RepID=A0ABY7DQ17_MYAAR|nr:MGAP-like protein [Mya arenaria]
MEPIGVGESWSSKVVEVKEGRTRSRTSSRRQSAVEEEVGHGWQGKIPQVKEKKCTEPGCRYGCICHLCKLSDSGEERESEIKPPCDKEYCKLGCICESIDTKKDLQKSHEDHCRKPGCMLECKCPPRQPKPDIPRDHSKRKKRGKQRHKKSSPDKDCFVDGEDFEDEVGGAGPHEATDFENWEPPSKKKKYVRQRYADLPRRETTYRLAKNLDAVSRKAMEVYATSEMFQERGRGGGKGPRRRKSRPMDIQPAKTASPIASATPEPPKVLEDKWKTQMVCLKARKKQEDKSTGQNSEIKLLEIISNCQWEVHRQNMLSKISHAISKDTTLGVTKVDTLEWESFVLTFLPKSDKPAIIPPELKSKLPDCMYSIRIKVVKKTEVDLTNENEPIEIKDDEDEKKKVNIKLQKKLIDKIKFAERLRNLIIAEEQKGVKSSKFSVSREGIERALKKYKTQLWKAYTGTSNLTLDQLKQALQAAKAGANQGQSSPSVPVPSNPNPGAAPAGASNWQPHQGENINVDIKTMNRIVRNQGFTVVYPTGTTANQFVPLSSLSQGIQSQTVTAPVVGQSNSHHGVVITSTESVHVQKFKAVPPQKSASVSLLVGGALVASNGDPPSTSVTYVPVNPKTGQTFVPGMRNPSSPQEVLLVPFKGGKLAGSGKVVKAPLVFVEEAKQKGLNAGQVQSSMTPGGISTEESDQSKQVSETKSEEAEVKPKDAGLRQKEAEIMPVEKEIKPEKAETRPEEETRPEVAELRTDEIGIKPEVAELRSEVAELKTEEVEIRPKHAALRPEEAEIIEFEEVENQFTEEIKKMMANRSEEEVPSQNVEGGKRKRNSPDLLDEIREQDQARKKACTGNYGVAVLIDSEAVKLVSALKKKMQGLEECIADGKQYQKSLYEKLEKHICKRLSVSAAALSSRPKKKEKKGKEAHSCSEEQCNCSSSEESDSGLDYQPCTASEILSVHSPITPICKSESGASSVANEGGEDGSSAQTFVRFRLGDTKSTTSRGRVKKAAENKEYRVVTMPPKGVKVYRAGSIEDDAFISDGIYPQGQIINTPGWKDNAFPDGLDAKIKQEQEDMQIHIDSSDEDEIQSTTGDIMIPDELDSEAEIVEPTLEESENSSSNMSENGAADVDGTSPDFSSLPDVAWVRILQHLPLQDRARAARTCHALTDAFNHPSLWSTQTLHFLGNDDNFRRKAEAVTASNYYLALTKQFGQYFQHLTIKISGHLRKMAGELQELLIEVAENCRLESLTLDVGRQTSQFHTNYGFPPDTESIRVLAAFVRHAFRMKHLNIRSWPMFEGIITKDECNIFKALKSNEKLKKNLEKLTIFWLDERDADGNLVQVGLFRFHAADENQLQTMIVEVSSALGTSWRPRVLKFGAVLGKKGLRRVYTAEHGATCGVSLQKDKIYLLSGSVNQSEKRLEINSCVSWVEGFPLSRPSRRLARKFKRGKVVCNKFGLINKLTAGDKKLGVVQSSPVQPRDRIDEHVLGHFQADLIVQHHAYIHAQAEVLQERRRQRDRRIYRKKRFLVRTWLTEDERVSAGQYHNLMVKLRYDEEQSFTNYLRMSSDIPVPAQPADASPPEEGHQGQTTTGTRAEVGCGTPAPGYWGQLPKVSRHTIASFLPDVGQSIIQRLEELPYSLLPEGQGWLGTRSGLALLVLDTTKLGLNAPVPLFEMAANQPHLLALLFPQEVLLRAELLDTDAKNGKDEGNQPTVSPAP